MPSPAATPPATSTVVITSYGLSHHDAPTVLPAVVVDTLPLDDPRVRQQLVRRTGRDNAVRAYVMATPGAERLVGQAVDRIRQRLSTSGRIEVHTYCRGGRHHSVAVAEEIGDRLRTAGVPVQVTHRHIARPILPTSQS
ncbi:hypothetical protein ACH4NT_36660 [Streptomyces lydicus]|uniref:RapZ C-terminal domain-containing protein n=1 Tax=Streptomyces lydicus TaxID=47763 RepID=UPI003795A4D6